MKIKEIYNFFVKEGIKEDLRYKSEINKKLKSTKLEYNKLSNEDKKLFDVESLTNPYSDTRVLVDTNINKIKRMLVGIDIGVGEILMAKMLADKDKAIDLVLSHHPEGTAWAGLTEVMDLQTDILSNIGIDHNIAKSFMDKRIDGIKRRLHGSNHQQVTDAAKLMEVSLMCCHTPSDNHVARYLQEMMDDKKPKKVKDLIDLLLKEPEYREGSKNKCGPTVLVGDNKNTAGRVFVDMTGGSSGSEELYARLSQLGIGTIICMHMSDNHYKKVKSEFINVIVAGHMASDSLGLNLILDKLVLKSEIDIVPCSGFFRNARK